MRDLDGLSKDLGPKPANRAIIGLFVPLFLLLAACGSGSVAKAQDLSITLPTLPVSPEASSLLPPAIKAAGVLKAATDAHFPTCDYYAEDGGTIIGFEADLRAALTQVLGLKLVSTSIDFAGLIPGISSRRYDIAMECLSDTADREKQVTFVDHGYSAGMTVFYPEKNTKIVEHDLHSLCGLKTAAPSGSTFVTALDVLNEFCRKAGQPPVTVAEVPQAATATLGVYAGRYDFGLTNTVAWSELQKAAPQPLKSFIYTLLSKNYNGIAIRKDDPELAAALLAALKIVHGSGVYDQIYRKWGITHAELDEPGINLFTNRPVPPPAP